MNAADVRWSRPALGEGIVALARAAGLDTSGLDLTAPPASVQDEDAELGRWMAWAGDRLGLEVESVDVTVRTLDGLLRDGGPVALTVGPSRTASVVLVLDTCGATSRVLGPDLQVHRCSFAALRDSVLDHVTAPLRAGVDRVLDAAALPARRRDRARDALAAARLGDAYLGRAWRFRVPPAAGWWAQVRALRLPVRLAAILAVFAVVYALEIAGWSLIGSAALDGRFDAGWLAAWVLLLVSLVPVRLFGAWLDASLVLDIGVRLKGRLLAGALRLDVEETRRLGIGHLLGRVLDSQAFESLALATALAALVALVELGSAAWVLGHGAAGTTHLWLLAGWIAAAAGCAAWYGTRLARWTDERLAMTHALVERMAGHRTTLVQEPPDRRDGEQDGAMTRYIEASAAMDRASMPLLAGLAPGWLWFGMAGLVPIFVAGHVSPARLAISVGGVLMAHRAFSGVSSGLTTLAGTVVAWRQVAPLLRAAVHQPGTAPFVSARQMRMRQADTPLLEAAAVTFRYRPGGEPAVREASVTMRQGERWLVEGGSGSGKSTLASLLAGVRTPQSGLLRLNGLDRQTLGDAWHRFATEAPQFHENHVFGGTLAFNLLMGRQWPPTEADLAEAQTVCLELGLGDLLARMPAGLMQVVGETGWQLSHGEQSRVFLARALLQAAELTVLDESFAALDPASIEACLASATRRASALAVIAHP